MTRRIRPCPAFLIWTKRGLLALVMSGAALRVAAAQASMTRPRVDTSFEDLRPDGNGIDGLRTRVILGFDGARASQALHMIATLAELNLTLDAELPELDRRVTIDGHSRSAAEALLEVASASRLRLRVSRAGQLVVEPLVPRVTAVNAKRSDSARAAVTLPVVRTEAPARERETFQSSTNVGELSITGRALGAAPQFVEPDVLRSVQTLPGIAARSDYVAGFNVRGGESDQTLIELDGFPIYSPFHFGGLFSTFIDPTVGRVDVRTGGLPAQYGGRLSGVLDVR
ncbi:MAG: TonB-dependent receptor plug domain-containing protein, partial [Gemmatimonadales bacterium]